MPEPIFSAAWISLRIAVFALSIGLVLFTIGSSIRTLILPRAANDWPTSFTFGVVRRVFALLLLRRRDYVSRDRIMAYYGPVSLLLLLPVWLTLILVAYAGLFWATGIDSLYDAFVLSGS
ncbi:MAG: hypothetical protein KDE24_02475, partial [Caldilinea sp.]|nr:hypothetical protein [Caldilinea sp.]